MDTDTVIHPNTIIKDSPSKIRIKWTTIALQEEAKSVVSTVIALASTKAEGSFLAEISSAESLFNCLTWELLAGTEGSLGAQSWYVPQLLRGCALDNQADN